VLGNLCGGHFRQMDEVRENAYEKNENENYLDEQSQRADFSGLVFLNHSQSNRGRSDAYGDYSYGYHIRRIWWRWVLEWDKWRR
jgi:hypothetical protein